MSVKGAVTTVIRRAAIIVIVATSIWGCGRSNRSRMTIAVIPKGTSHVFWRSIHAGADKAARELGVEVVWRGPIREDDRSEQIAEVEGFITRGVSGIVLAPLDDTALVEPVADAARSHIPVVVIDSALKGHDYVSFVATDNAKGGRMAGDYLASRLQGKGRVVVLRYAEGSASTIEREQGFLDAIAVHHGIQIVSANQYGGADVEGAYKKAEAMLSVYKAPDGALTIDGIFCPNESTTFAMLRVLQDNGWAGKVRLVGFDTSESLGKALADGQVDALVLQDPVNIGYLGVKAIVEYIRSDRGVPPRIDTGVHLATRDHLNDPEIQRLLHPDVSP